MCDLWQGRKTIDCFFSCAIAAISRSFLARNVK